MRRTICDVFDNEQAECQVRADLSARQVVEYMYDKEVSAVAVCEEGTVIGVFSERDLLRRVVYKQIDPARVNIREVMSRPVYWISLDERYEVAIAIMVDKVIRQLVVMSFDHEFLGFISSRELLEADLLDSRELVGKLNDEYYEHRFMPTPATRS